MPNKWERKEKMVRYLQRRIREKFKKKRGKSVHELVDKPLLKDHAKKDMLDKWYEVKGE
jgi:hypothetical protein